LSFSVIFATILLCGWLAGRFAARLRVPQVLGMLLAGIIITRIFGSHIPESLAAIQPFLKNFALIVILLRAGLGINRRILKQTGKVAVLMAAVPCLIEGTALYFGFRYLFRFPADVAGMSAFMLAAVSPAVVVPSMLNLKQLGYGANKQVPTIVLAGASLDDVFAITMFSIFVRMYSTGSGMDMLQILRIPYSILMGAGVGVLFGLLLIWLFKRIKQFRATEKLIVLIGLCLVMIELGEHLHIASFLAAMTVGYMLFERAYNTAKEMASKLSKLWIFAEIILFVLIGMSLNPAYLLEAGAKGVLIVLWGLLFRSFGVVLATIGSGLNRRERLFCVLAYLPKATVQAALGTIPLALGVPQGQLILAIAVMAIAISAPLGLILINTFGHRLLAKD
jgi:NhaP-type Na+/H+ or K+/H+ antiporter